MSRPALIDKLCQAGKWLFKPELIPVDDVTIKRGSTAISVAVDALVRSGGGLAVDGTGKLYVDFASMPTGKFESMLKSIRVPVWLGSIVTRFCTIERCNAPGLLRGKTSSFWHNAWQQLATA